MRAAEQLPPGRHGLSRKQVARSQRQRILRSIAEAVSEQGYVMTSVADVLRRAGVSRETFYELFGNKQECFLAAYDASANTLLEAAQDAARSAPASDGVAEKLERLLARYLEVLAKEPAIAHTFLVEVYAAGPAALARRVEVQSRFVDVLAKMVGADDGQERFACEALVAATSALVTQRVCAGRSTELEKLHAPLVRFARGSLSACGLL
jgi:AcrR family transcriptional regulator